MLCGIGSPWGLGVAGAPQGGRAGPGNLSHPTVPAKEQGSQGEAPAPGIRHLPGDRGGTRVAWVISPRGELETCDYLQVQLSELQLPGITEIVLSIT